MLIRGGVHDDSMQWYMEYERKFRWYLEQFGPEGDDPLLWYDDHDQGD